MDGHEKREVTRGAAGLDLRRAKQRNENLAQLLEESIPHHRSPPGVVAPQQGGREAGSHQQKQHVRMAALQRHPDLDHRQGDQCTGSYAKNRLALRVDFRIGDKPHPLQLRFAQFAEGRAEPVSELGVSLRDRHAAGPARTARLMGKLGLAALDSSVVPTTIGVSTNGSFAPGSLGARLK